ncbi:MAG: hypothetical protein CSB06_00980 [Bacteroidia bacterium]|nr:MAG: hypothetical protein CSB06_00980 [Bacteroidia bacterium]
MKSYRTIFIIPAILLLFITSCKKKDYQAPEQKTYTPSLQANTSIKELKMLYKGKLTCIEDSLVLAATVVANDKSGNYYKTIVVQDSTGGIEIGLNAYNLHNKYHVGDLLLISCKKLFLGQYAGQIKLGSDYEGEIGRIEEPLIPRHIFKTEGGKPIPPRHVSLADLKEEFTNTLVILENVQFSANYVGSTFATPEYQLDKIIDLEDQDGQNIKVKTSGYANFAGDTIPEKTGNLIAVYTKFKDDNQLIIRDINEVNLTKKRTGSIFFESFRDGFGKFTEYSVKGNQKWEYKSGFKCVLMSGYSSGSRFENEDWLISPPINLSYYSGLTLTFRHALNYKTSYNDTEVYISDDYDGSSDPSKNGTWTKLNVPTYPPGNNWDWFDSGDIDLSAYGGKKNIYLAFKYKSTNTQTCTWQINDVKIKTQN